MTSHRRGTESKPLGTGIPLETLKDDQLLTGVSPVRRETQASLEDFPNFPSGSPRISWVPGVNSSQANINLKGRKKIKGALFLPIDPQ